MEHFICGHTRSSGDHQPATTKPPLYIVLYASYDASPERYLGVHKYLDVQHTRVPKSLRKGPVRHGMICVGSGKRHRNNSQYAIPGIMLILCCCCFYCVTYTWCPGSHLTNLRILFSSRAVEGITTNQKRQNRSVLTFQARHLSSAYLW